MGRQRTDEALRDLLRTMTVPERVRLMLKIANITREIREVYVDKNGNKQVRRKPRRRRG